MPWLVCSWSISCCRHCVSGRYAAVCHVTHQDDSFTVCYGLLMAYEFVMECSLWRSQPAGQPSLESLASINADGSAARGCPGQCLCTHWQIIVDLARFGGSLCGLLCCLSILKIGYRWLQELRVRGSTAYVIQVATAGQNDLGFKSLQAGFIKCQIRASACSFISLLFRKEGRGDALFLNISILPADMPHRRQCNDMQ